jgi:hypothetical protein
MLRINLAHFMQLLGNIVVQIMENVAQHNFRVSKVEYAKEMLIFKWLYYAHCRRWNKNLCKTFRGCISFLFNTRAYERRESVCIKALLKLNSMSMQEGNFCFFLIFL